MRAKVPQTMTVCAAYLEAQIVEPWVAGNGTASWMAICIPSAAGWRDGVDMTRFPKLTAYLERVGQRDAVRRAVKEAQG